MSKSLRVLIIEDSKDDAFLLLQELQTGGYDVDFERVETLEALQNAFQNQEWELILSAYSMPHFSGLDALKIAQEKMPDTPFMIISSSTSEEAAVEAVKAGAQDYFSMGSISRLVPTVQKALHQANVQRKQKWVESQLLESETHFAKVFHTSPVAISISSLVEGVLIEVNESFIDLFGYQQGEIIGSSILDLGIYADPSNHTRLVQQFEAQGSLHQIEIKVRTRNGETRDIFGSLQILELGQKSYILTTAYDLTERKKLNVPKPFYGAAAMSLSC